ncbi:MAG: hypothetical protein Alis3KO_29210 [Aliiglaciecola sp.]
MPPAAATPDLWPLAIVLAIMYKLEGPGEILSKAAAKENANNVSIEGIKSSKIDLNILNSLTLALSFVL